MPKTLSDGGPLLDDPVDNPLFYSWNHVEIAYCDGASFSGNRDDPIVVNGTTLYFRGFRVLQAVIRDLLERQGMWAATEVLLTGCSAGALSTYLHVDQIRDMLPKTVTRFKAAPFSGLFLHEPNVEGVPVYQSQLRRVFEMQNCTGGVPQACIAAQKPGEEWRCIFAQEVHPFIQSPFFIMNSAYDSWSAVAIPFPSLPAALCRDGRRASTARSARKTRSTYSTRGGETQFGPSLQRVQVAANLETVRTFIAVTRTV